MFRSDPDMADGDRAAAAGARPDVAAWRARVEATIAAAPFRPARGLSGPHAQTCWPTIARRSSSSPAPSWTRERVAMPDGGAVSVYRIAPRTGRPTLLLLHGLEGGPRSHYVLGTGRRFAARGWGIAALAFRSCDGDAPATPRMYHSGETSDLDAVVRHLTGAGGGGGALYVAGFSLGANVLGKWLGEQGGRAPVAGAALVSAPYDLAACATTMDRVLGGAYARWFLRPLRRKVATFDRLFPGRLPVEDVRACRSIVRYDDLVTAPLHGFAGAADYYARSSCGPLLDAVRVPTLLVSSEDDPLIPRATWPVAAADANPWLVPAWTRRGGHLGFCARGADAWWAEATIERVFATIAGEA